MKVVEDIKPIAIVKKTNAQLSNPGITYNEEGVTFNDERYTFGGVGIDGERDIFPFIASIKDIKPRISGFEDIGSSIQETPGDTQGMPMGLLLSLTYPS
jgi:hypothetical protein